MQGIYFDFNKYSGLILPAVLNGYFKSIFIFTIKKCLNCRIISLIIFFTTLFLTKDLLEYAGWFDGRDSHTFFLIYFPFQNLAFIGFLIWLFSFNLLHPDLKLKNLPIKYWLVPVIFLSFKILKIIIDFGFYYPFPIDSYNNFGTIGPISLFENSFYYKITEQFIFNFYLYLSVKNIGQLIDIQSILSNIKILISILFYYNCILFLVNIAHYFLPNSNLLSIIDSLELPLFVIFFYVISIILLNKIDKIKTI